MVYMASDEENNVAFCRFQVYVQREYDQWDWWISLCMDLCAHDVIMNSMLGFLSLKQRKSN